jgi:hypothetical protein
MPSGQRRIKSRKLAATAAFVSVGTVAFVLLTTPGVMAQTTLTLNGASGTNTLSATQSTTGGLVINQIFGVE